MADALHRTPRLYVEAPLAAGEEIVLDRAQSHYVANVMRAQAGAGMRLFNGRDGEWLAYLSSVSKRACVVAIDQRLRQQENLPDIHYLFAPLKHARLDYMVQKATEMGAAVLQPVITEHTNVARLKLERARANIIEAAEQCNLLAVPEMREAVKLSRVLANWNRSRQLIFCDECAEKTSPVAALQEITAGPLAVLIGPEGGFSPAERDMLHKLDYAHAIGLGPRIMRADTAAVAALALVQSVLGDWRQP
jgi:16S rRNA (uracil1498-N3)-methyltransferase